MLKVAERLWVIKLLACDSDNACQQNATKGKADKHSSSAGQDENAYQEHKASVSRWHLKLTWEPVRRACCLWDSWPISVFVKIKLASSS